jgi:hypothetical protein
MTNSLVAADFDFSFDVLRNITTKVAFNGVVLVDEIPHANDLFVSQVADTGCQTDIESLADLCGSGTTDSIDVSECDLNSLLSREIDSCDTGHSGKLLSLPLLVARVGANHANSTVAPDNEALVTDLFDAGADFHWST